ncbi:MAG: hypothetical protein QOI75_5473, partial [Pseudonocardiales bacterium]|nr:hypothetical protein [Pseudonocardiales bacterium]
AGQLSAPPARTEGAAASHGTGAN